MPSTDEVCAAAANAVTVVDGLRAKGWIDDQINPPEVQIYTQAFDPRMVFGRGDSYGASTHFLAARLFVRRTDPRTAQRTIRDYLETSGTGSIIAALEDDANWSEDVHDVTVTQLGQPFEADIASGGDMVATYWCVDIDFEVIW